MGRKKAFLPARPEWRSVPTVNTSTSPPRVKVLFPFTAGIDANGSVPLFYPCPSMQCVARFCAQDEHFNSLLSEPRSELRTGCAIARIWIFRCSFSFDYNEPTSINSKIRVPQSRKNLKSKME